MREIRCGRPQAAFDLIVMVGSLGGLRSTAAVLAGLPGDFPVPLLVLLHAARQDAPEVLAGVLQRSTDLVVHTARDGERAATAGVTVLPRAQTATIDRDGLLRLTPAGPGRGGDVLLSSAASAAGKRTIGVVLTGLLRDGSDGVRAIKRRGGRVLAEDPRTAQADSMPAHAIATGCVDFAMANDRLAAAIIALSLAPGGAEMFSVPTPSWATLDA